MKHLGDITRINGHEAPPVDIITGGSPCQDLSVAGKRAGLAGERSGLFMEQIRIIKEMRNESREHNRTTAGSDDNIRPRYMVWENVAGAFSSNNGEDFRAVLEETARIEEAGVCIPRLEDGQRWPHAGCIMGNGWSIAWRLHDAQHWGVPQRRKRISLVADFGGRSAAKILFKCEGVSGCVKKSKEKREGTTTELKKSPDSSSEIILFEPRSQDGVHRIKKDLVSPTLNTAQGGQRQPCVLMDGIARRVTPLECERLQGYPDGWTDIGEWTDSKGKKHKESDAPRYKALGNSIALPFWEWMAERMINELQKSGETTPTMASLFDGIGGFPLVYSRHGCEPVWASEIEEFPMAVTRARFPEQ